MPTPGQLSIALAFPKIASLTTAPHIVAPGPVDAVTGEGGVMDGGVLSTTATIAEH